LPLDHGLDFPIGDSWAESSTILLGQQLAPPGPTLVRVAGTALRFDGHSRNAFR
jgi:hypothetical protein